MRTKQPLLYLAIIFALCFYSSDAAGQINFGLAGGLNISNGQFKTESEKLKPVPRYFAGVFADVSISRSFRIEPVVLYSVKGWSYKFSGTQRSSTNLHSVDFQLLLKYFLGNEIYVIAGGEVGYLTKVRANRRNITNRYESLNAGVLIGLERRMSDLVRLNVKYIHGVSNLAKFDITAPTGQIIGEGEDGKTRVLQIGVSVDLIHLSSK